jgi:hypothetical protein
LRAAIAAAAKKQHRLPDIFSLLSEGELAQELAGCLQAVALPSWVPKTALVRRAPAPWGRQHDAIFRPVSSPGGVHDPLLAARLVAGTRGPVFIRDAAPSLSHLLSESGSPTLACRGTFELWLPLRPEHAHTLRCPTTTPARRPAP